MEMRNRGNVEVVFELKTEGEKLTGTVALPTAPTRSRTARSPEISSPSLLFRKPTTVK
jgi:hypothetical protein